MRVIKQSVELMDMTEYPLHVIERAGRTCYKSEDCMTKDSAEAFVRRLIKRGHEAMIEHAYASYRFVTDRGVSHEIVRCRLFSFAQESTRYCSYGDGVTFIEPVWFGEEQGIHNLETYWEMQMRQAETAYKTLLRDGWSAQQARSVLPNSLKTEIVVTGNFREWKLFFELRTASDAHPQMRELALMCLSDFRKRCPVIVESINA